MKSIILLACIVPGLAFCQTEPTAEDTTPRAEIRKQFKVSKVGKPGAAETRERFMELWAALQTGGEAGVPRTIKILQALHKDGDLFLYVAEVDGVKSAVRLKNAEMLEGQTARVVLCRSGVEDMTSILGAPKRFPAYKEGGDAPEKGALTREVFLANLKEGMTYEVKVLAKGGCEKCFGDGKLSALQKNAPCPDCQGTGDALVVWTLAW